MGSAVAQIEAVSRKSRDQGEKIATCAGEGLRSAGELTRVVKELDRILRGAA